MKRSDRAVELFKSGYNCAQAVFAAFADKYGMDEETALKISASFGAGMGRMREVCGTVSGMMLVNSLENGSADAKDQEAKKHNYEVARELAAKFKEDNGSIICAELLGLKKDTKEDAAPSARTKEYYKKRPCVELVRNAAEILEEKFGD